MWLVLTASQESVTLLVSDDGQGISAAGNRRGLACRALRERADQLGGELHLEPRRAAGQQLSFRLPLPPAASDIKENSEDGNNG